MYMYKTEKNSNHELDFNCDNVDDLEFGLVKGETIAPALVHL